MNCSAFDWIAESDRRNRRANQAQLSWFRAARLHSSFSLCWLASLALLLTISASVEYAGTNAYDPFYDSGVYLESARVIRRGYPAYGAVFSSQPPLWLMLLRLSFYLGSESFFASQVLMATSAMIMVAGVIAIVARLQGRVPALMAGALVAFAPVELNWSHKVIAEVPSVAFAVIAMAAAVRYLFVGRRVWLALTAIAITCSILTKLFGLYTGPAILLMIIGRWSGAPGLSRAERLQGLGRDILIIGVILFGSIAVLAAAAGPAKLWDQAVRFHWKAAGLSQVTSAANWRMIVGGWPSAQFSWVMFGLCSLCIAGGWLGLAILSWPGCILLGLLPHRPLFMHHLLELMPAVAVAAAFGWGQLWRLSVECWKAPALPRRITAISGVGACVALAAFLALQLQNCLRAYESSMHFSTSDIAEDQLAAQRLRALTAPDDMVLTDAQGIAFLAHRDVPPGLTDTSFKRITTGYLSARQVIGECEKFHVRAALLWTGRLDQMPEVSAWVKQHFSQRDEFARGRVLWSSAR